MPGSPIAIIRGVSQRYLRGSWLSLHRTSVTALDGVDLTIPEGAIFALQGPSGSGKSTLARCIAGLEKPRTGTVTVNGVAQLVFQEPGLSFNPRFTVRQIVEEPLRIHRQPLSRAGGLLEETGIPGNLHTCLSANLSGGQRARVALARALSMDPSLLILDETLSSLDLSTQAQIVNLLLDLREARSLTYILITHHRKLATSIATECRFMEKGRVLSQPC